jgi:hypothetical protein
MRFLLPLLIPIAAKWAAHHERRILRLGKPLPPLALEDAKRMGVRHPDRIRVMEVAHIPLLNSRPVEWLARLIPGVSSGTIGLSLRYGIYLRQPFAGSRRLLAHECVHIAQYERLDGIRPFLRCYLTECTTHGYPRSPLEREAVERSAAISDPASAS